VLPVKVKKTEIMRSEVLALVGLKISIDTGSIFIIQLLIYFNISMLERDHLCSLCSGQELLAMDPEIPGLIPGASRFSDE
jgi:hypothetical protein